jgi:hypothetical protein
MVGIQGRQASITKKLDPQEDSDPEDQESIPVIVQLLRKRYITTFKTMYPLMEERQHKIEW